MGGSGVTIHARRNKDKVSSALRGSALSMGFGSVSSYSVPAIRKIGVTPPNMSDQTKRRQDEWDKQNELREKQKELNRLVAERKQRLSGNGNSNDNPNQESRCFLCSLFSMFS